MFCPSRSPNLVVLGYFVVMILRIYDQDKKILSITLIRMNLTRIKAMKDNGRNGSEDEIDKVNGRGDEEEENRYGDEYEDSEDWDHEDHEDEDN